MYTSRFTLGYNTQDPLTGAELGDRYITVVDHAPDASHARNRERMHQLWGKTYAFPYDEDSWGPEMVERYRMVEHARFEFGAAQPGVTERSGTEQGRDSSRACLCAGCRSAGDWNVS